MSKLLILNQSIADGLEVIGDRWTLLILREAFKGHTRFEHFIEETGISRATLTRRLKSMIEDGLLKKSSYGASKNRFEYFLSRRGLKLVSGSILAAAWERRWQTTDHEKLPDKITHTACGKVLSPLAVCRHCSTPLDIDEVEWPQGEQHINPQFALIRSHEKPKRKRAADTKHAGLAELIGDRWTLLLLIAALFGTRRYDSFRKQLNIPPNILAARLKNLIANSILTKEVYQEHPPRSEYQLTAKGKALFPFVMTLRQWVIDSLSNSNSVAHLLHKNCNHALHVDVICSSCKEIPKPTDLKF